MCPVLVASRAELAPVKQGLRNTPDAEARGSPRHVVHYCQTMVRDKHVAHRTAAPVDA